MRKLLGIFALAILFFSSCDKTPESGDITITLNHKIGNQAFAMNEMIYQTNVGHDFSITRLAYYLSDFTFHNTSGSNYHKEMYHLYDEEKSETGNIVFEDIPAGNYDKVTFTFGLDEEKNIDDGLDNTVDNQNMAWPIPGDQGYHYMKYEGKYDSLGMGVIKPYNIHLGATQGNQNFFHVTLDLPTIMKVDDNSWSADLEMNILEWFQNPEDYDFAAFGKMIMMNQSAQHVLRNNGQFAFSITAVSGK